MLGIVRFRIEFLTSQILVVCLRTFSNDLSTCETHIMVSKVAPVNPRVKTLEVYKLCPPQRCLANALALVP